MESSICQFLNQLHLGVCGDYFFFVLESISRGDLYDLDRRRELRRRKRLEVREAYLEDREKSWRNFHLFIFAESEVTIG